MGAWDSLSIREKADMMKAAIRNGITTLPEIKQAYNEFAEGGDTVGEWADAIYQNNPKEEFLGEPEHHYDFTQSEEWADAHGYYPDARGHRDDRVKKPAHPSHPSRGTWEGNKFVLSELGMQNPNYTLFGLNDGGQDPQAVLTYQGGSVIPEITATPKGNYIYNPYDNIRLRYSEGGNIYGGGGQKKSGGSFYQTHRARWFNFLCKKGVNPVKAERLASYFSAQDALESGHGTSSAARQKNNYGGMQRLDKRTNKMVNVSYSSINDYMNAKWKMMNSRFGRALNAKSIQEYANILNDPKYHGKGYVYGLYEGYRDGQPLDVARQTKYMNNYTKIMMDIAGERGFKDANVPDDLSIVQPENPYTQFIPFEPFNPQVFNNPQAFVAPTREQFEVEQPIVEAAKDYAYSPEQLEREERRQGLNNLSFILGMMNGGNGNSFADTIGMLTGNIAANGGKIHIKPKNRGKFTALKKRTGHSATWFKEHGTPAQRKMATFALNARHWKHGYGGHIYDGTTEDTQQMNIPYVGELPDVEILGKKRNNVLRQVTEHWVTNDKGEEVPTYWGYNPTSKQYEQLYKLTGDTDMENSVFSTYDNRHTFNIPQATEMRKAHEQWVKNGGNASDFDKVMLKYLMAGVAPIALPEIVAGVSSLPIWDAIGAGAETLLAKEGVQNALPWIKSGIASYFAADGLNRFIGPEGAAKTDKMFSTMVNDPNWYNMVNFGKSALGDVLDVSMAGPVVEAATGLKFSTEAAADLLSAAKNVASKSAESVQSTLSNIPSAYYKGKRILLGNKHQPNIIWRALGLPNRHFDAWRTRHAMENAYQTINTPLQNREYLLKNLNYLRDKEKLGTHDYAFTYDTGDSIFEPGKYEDISYPISIEMPDKTLLTGTTFGKSYIPGKVVTPIEIGQSSQIGFGNVGKIPHLESPSGSAPGIDFLISNDASFQKGLKNYVKDLEKEIDAPVAGSTRLISEDFFGGSPGDTEVYVPEGLFGEVSNKLGFQKARPLRSDTGYAGYSPKGFIGKDGRENVDINIIKDDGTIIHQIESTKNPEHMPKLYDNFARENAKFDTPPAISASLKIPKEDGSGYYTAEEYFDSIKKDKNVITQNVIDNNFKSSQDKHFKRAFVMMNSDTPRIVKSVSTAIDHMVAQIPGMKRFSNIFKAQKFDNVEENKAILEKIGFKPFDVDKFASNPEQMRNIVDYWYMRKTVGTRGVNYSPSGGVAENSSIDSVMNATRSLDNGSTAGGGGNEVLGNTFGGFTRYYTASNYHAPILDENIATFDDVFNYFKREHDIWTKDTPLVEKTVKDVFAEYKLPLEKLSEVGSGVYSEAKFTNVITNLVRSKKISASKGEEVIDEIAKRLNVTGYRGDNYAGYGDYYGNLRMASRDKKSLSTLRNIDSGTHNQPLLPAEWGTDRFFDISKGAENSSYYNVWKQPATDGSDELGALAAERPDLVVDLRQFRNSDGSVSTQKITDAYNEAYARRTARQRAQAERLNKSRSLEEKSVRARDAAYKRAKRAMAGAGMAGLGFGIYSLVSSGMHNAKEGRILRSHEDELNTLFSEYARELKVDPHLWDRDSRGDIDSDTEDALVRAYESAAQDILNKYKK